MSILKFFSRNAKRESLEDIVFVKGEEWSKGRRDIYIKQKGGLSKGDENYTYFENMIKGINGERQVVYQLKRSGIPMYILQNLKISSNDNNAEIDFLVITQDSIFIIECKNWNSSIEVDRAGTLFGVYKDKRTPRDNPYTQCLHQKIMLKQLLGDQDTVKMTPKEEERFEKQCKILVVFTNEKGAVDIDERCKEMDDIIVRYDKLIEKMEKLIKQNKNSSLSKLEIEQMVEYLIGRDEEIREKMLRNNLINYRQEELDNKQWDKTKAKYIFTDDALEEVTKNRPANIEELKGLKGFGDKNTAMYGEGILECVEQFIC